MGRPWKLPPSLDMPVAVILKRGDNRVPVCSLCGFTLMARERPGGEFLEFDIHTQDPPTCGSSVGLASTSGEHLEEEWPT